MTARELLSNRLLQVLAAGIALSIALALAWKYTPLAGAISPEKTIAWIESFDEEWWAPFALLLAFTPACFVMFPRQLIIIAAAVAFGPYKGWLVSISGVLLAAFVGWALGRRMNEERVHRWAGPRFERVARILRKRGLVAIMAVRLLPVAPFVVESVVAGGLRMKATDVLLGTFFGMAPGMFVTSVVGDQVAAAFAEHRAFNPWMIAGAIVLMVLVAWGAKAYFGKLEREAGSVS